MQQIKLAIIDDQNLFRVSLAYLIESIPEFKLVAQAADGEELLANFDKLKEIPDVLLMDMNMPGMNGVALNAIIQEKYPEIRVIVLSVHTQERLIAKMINAGAAAYLIKNCEREELITAIKSTYETGFYISRRVMLAVQKSAMQGSRTSSIFNRDLLELTSREREVLQLICEENSSAEIATRLFLSIRTVEGHRNNLLLKTESKNTAGLVLFAIRSQLFEVL